MIPIEKLKDYVKKHTAPKIKDSIAKSPRKLKGEKGTAEKLERNVREEGELFSDSETIESNDQIEDEERKKVADNPRRKERTCRANAQKESVCSSGGSDPAE